MVPPMRSPGQESPSIWENGIDRLRAVNLHWSQWSHYGLSELKKAIGLPQAFGAGFEQHSLRSCYVEVDKDLSRELLRSLGPFRLRHSNGQNMH